MNSDKTSWIDGFKYALRVRTMIKPSLHNSIAEEYYELMSSDKPSKGQMVECIHPHDPDSEWVKCEVVAPLSVQFTVVDCDDRIFYYFYSDKGDTWRPLSEPSSQG